MLFKKRPPSQPRRTRQPVRPDGFGTKPVFSYHARADRPEQAGARRTNRLLWVANSTKVVPSSPRTAPRRSAPKKFLMVVLTIVGTALVLNSLILNRDPEILPLADTRGRQLLLRSHETYYEAIRRVLGGSLTNLTKLTVDTKDVALAIQKQFPELEAVSVAFPVVGHQPTVYLQPAEPVLLLKSADGGLFVLGTSGRVLADAAPLARLKKLALPVVEDQSGLQIAPGSTVLPSDNISFITEVVGQLRAKRLTVTGLTLPRGTSELDVRIKGEAYFIKFNLRGNARAEAGAFLAVKKHLERENKTPRSYIDVRVENKAYYR